MGLRFMKFVCLFIGGVVGYAIALILEPILTDQPGGANQVIPNTPGIIIVFALLGFMVATLAYRSLLKFNEWFLKLILQSNGPKLVNGIIGGGLGFVLALLFNTYVIESIFMSHLPQYYGLKILAFVGVIVILVYLGSFFMSSVKIGLGTDEDSGDGSRSPKVLDTNIIIDGRISDIIRSKFLEGMIIVPQSVLKELHKLSDSTDTLKRNRGRLGLEHLNKIQEDPEIKIEIYDDFSEPDEDTFDVDSHLVSIAKKIGGKIVTNDYNLNKVAVLQGVEVLNINELANALKPIFLPGENLQVQIIKHGKESGQGVAYLDDGTMIVVEGGDGFIGNVIEVAVTSILQTVAGRLIFAKPVKEV
jgi:uncharacterized protein YacL